MIDLTVMRHGKRYEDTYGNYLKVFQIVAEAPESIAIKNPPVCWIPLLRYLGAEIHGSKIEWECDKWLVVPDKFSRSDLEVLCGLRPELVDSLWKSDMEWNTILPQQSKALMNEVTFNVCTPAAYFRKEILRYLSALHNFEPSKKKAILCPCAADKPYPSELHSAILKIMPDDYHLIIATGVLGLVPFELWGIAPQYDAGIPNEWRVQEEIINYFSKFKYEVLISYTDFYSEAIHNGCILTGQPVIFPLTYKKEYQPYLNLLDSANLDKLQGCIDSTK